jgi:hypothetical protein
VAGFYMLLLWLHYCIPNCGAKYFCLVNVLTFIVWFLWLLVIYRYCGGFNHSMHDIVGIAVELVIV